jgi:hypothetical protein
MGSKLGVHITPGSRNGYGEVAAAGLAVAIAIGEHGALLEAWQATNRKTITIYRDMTVFTNGDAPDHFPQMSEEEARNAADKYWPKLRAVYETHPADYYQATNEIGGSGDDSVPSFRNLVAFETRLMELSEADGGKFKLAVCSLSGGTPGNFERWKELLVPLIRRAGQGGHIYSRHAYGPGLLTKDDGSATDGNSGRPFKEAEYLRSQGIFTPMVITEAGPNAGYKFPGAGEFMKDVKRFDALCQQHDNIWGFCCWTYGDWRDGAPNIEPASARLAAYLKQQGGVSRPLYPNPAIVDDSPAEPPSEAIETPAAGSLAYKMTFDSGIEADYLKPGQPFTPTWTLTNTGTVAWQGAFRYAYVDRSLDRTSRFSREQMAGKAAYSLMDLTGRDSLQPGESIALKLKMTAPQEPGMYASHWELRSTTGQAFGGTRYLVIEVKSEEQLVETPVDTPTAPTGVYRYRGPNVKYFTGLHGPADDAAWNRPGFKGKIQELNLPLVFMSNGINPDFAGMGDPARNVVRLYWNPRKATADGAYEEIRDDQLKRWWGKGYRRFIFFNEPQLRKADSGQSEEGMGIAWHSADEFARYLKTCLSRANKEFPGIHLYTTPVTSNEAFDPWGWRDAIWKHNRKLVKGWCMHAYSGNNSNAAAAVDEILNQVKKLQRRFNVQIPIIVSEASVNRGEDAEQKAKVALMLEKKAAQIRGLEAVYWYAADWDPSFDHHNEGWFRKGIADAYLRQRG